MTHASPIFLGLLLSLAPPCHGHTGLEWDSVQGESHFRVYRCVAGSCLIDQRMVEGALKPFPANLLQWTLVGNTLGCNRAPFDGDPQFICRHWELLRASSIPVMNISYDYAVQTVDPWGRVSGGSNVVRCGPQDITSCYANGVQIPCP